MCVVDLFRLIADPNRLVDQRKLGLLLHDCVQVLYRTFFNVHNSGCVFKIKVIADHNRRYKQWRIQVGDCQTRRGKVQSVKPEKKLY